MDDLQFFPTPPSLAKRVWKKFKNRDFERVLDPQGGNGDLADANPFAEEHWNRRRITVDVCEIDVSRHPTLREKGYKVVGLDFLQFGSCSVYSHIILNPPYRNGATHFLKAWDACYHAEISGLLNAETIRNPYTAERQRLVKLIELHGEVEFIEGAFSGPDAERKTDVEVALVYLNKEASASDLVGDILAELREDEATADDLAGDFRNHQELALPNSFVENIVRAFNAAVKTMQEAVKAEAKASYYGSLLGDTLAVRKGNVEEDKAKANTSVEYVRNTISKRYDELRDAAWAEILYSTNVRARLSQGAQRRLEAEFQQIKKMEVTAQNIYGFLYGLVAQQGAIQIEMICDVFDAIGRYHTDNLCFYRGWKSNDRHRTMGLRVKTTRFILPGHKTESYHSKLPYDSERMLDDFDKVFAMLDGKLEPELSLRNVCRMEFSDLRRSKRISSSYFDIRYYPGIGTLHFFPLRKDLVDRLNRVVGAKRQWLPPEGTRVSEDFWIGYEKAERLDKEVRAEINRAASSSRSWWDHPLHRIADRATDDSRVVAAHEAVDKAIATVHERHGINVDAQLDDAGNQQMLLLEAA